MNIKRKFTVEELDSFTEEELSIYDGDEPQPGQPGVWLLGIESTDRDFARYEAWRRRNDLDKMTNFDYDEFLEAEAEKEAAAKRSPFAHRQTSAPKTIDDWLRVLPDMRPDGRNRWKGPCPLCGEGDDRFNIKEGETAEVVVLCRECQRQGKHQDQFFKELLDRFFPKEIPLPKPARSKHGPLKPEILTDPPAEKEPEAEDEIYDLADFYYITSDPNTPFYHLPSDEPMRSTGARLSTGFDVEAWGKITAKGDFIKTASVVLSSPGLAPGLHRIDKKRIVNKWERPEHPEPSSARAAEVAEILEANLVILFPVEEERAIIKNFMAWIYQRPGQRLNWGLYVYSPTKGNGKTMTFSDMFRSVIGDRNCDVLFTEVIDGQVWTEWKSEGELAIIEDLIVSEKRRAAVSNKFKDAVGNAKVSMLIRNVGKMPADNLQNYIIISNQADCITVDRMERRWFYPTVTDEYQGPEYYSRLLHAVRDAGAVAKWLREHPISPEFEEIAKYRAPWTPFKQSLITETTGDASLLEDVIEGQETRHVNAHYCGANAAREALKSKGFKGRYVYSLMRELGYQKMGRKHKLDGNTQEIYVKDYNEQMRAYRENGMTEAQAEEAVWNVAFNRGDPIGLDDVETGNQGCFPENRSNREPTRGQYL